MSRGDDLVIDRGDLVIDPIYLSIYLAQTGSFASGAGFPGLQRAPPVTLEPGQ